MFRDVSSVLPRDKNDLFKSVKYEKKYDSFRYSRTGRNVTAAAKSFSKSATETAEYQRKQLDRFEKAKTGVRGYRPRISPNGNMSRQILEDSFRLKTDHYGVKR